MTKDGNFVGFQKGKKVANTLSEASVVESMVLSCPVCGLQEQELRCCVVRCQPGKRRTIVEEAAGKKKKEANEVIRSHCN